MGLMVLLAQPGCPGRRYERLAGGLSRARYVWLIGNGGNTSERIAWTWSLFWYFDRHFRLVKFASGFRGKGDVPRGGLYVRT